MEAVAGRKKRLIVHMDDMGMGLGANLAGMELFARGRASSASIMVPCAWAYDFARWSAVHPQYDVGVHGTHTCEWEAARWRPLAGPEPAGTDGFMPKTAEELSYLTAEQYEQELEAQIRTALGWGLCPSHLDNHMWTLRIKPEFLQIHLRLAERYRLVPCLLEELAGEHWWPELPSPVAFPAEGAMEERTAALAALLEKKPAGDYILTVHPAVDLPELRAVIPGWEQRYEEYRILRDGLLAGELERLGVELISWRDIASGDKPSGPVNNRERRRMA